MTPPTWTPATPWFDVAMVTGLFAIGSILFGRFEEHKPRWRRVLKLVLVTAIYLAVARTAGRVWAMGLLALPILGAAWIHLVWLPRHGVDGWTGEPRQRYLDLVVPERKRL
jgi:hypothetical protein